MTLEVLQNIWFLLFAVLIIGYAILDGFDLGVGFWSLFEKDARHRGQYMDVIAPVWDGNEVWLLTAGGALFAAFPPVYATVFSGFYLALMVLLAALMLRAVSFEFRHKVESFRWHRVWDLVFGLSSLLPALLFGVAVGNILEGVPVERVQGGFIWRGSFLGLLNPYALLIGLMTVAMFATHGALYLAYKAHGEVGEKAERRAMPALIAWALLWAAAMVATLIRAPFLMERATSHFFGYLFFILSVLGLLAIFFFQRAKRYFHAFLASCATIASQTALAASGLHPRLVPSSLDLEDASLTIYNASSTERTLLVMLVIALVGVPIVIAYTAFIYRCFKGKVRPGEFYGEHS